MGRSALTARSDQPTGMSDHVESGEGSPATRLLDAMGTGDFEAALAELSQAVAVTARSTSWCFRGPEDVGRALSVAFERFPGLVFDSHVRQVGEGLVIEEARVRDEVAPLEADPDLDSPAGAGSTASETQVPETVHIEVWHGDLDERDEASPPAVIDAESWDAFEVDPDNGRSVLVWQDPDTTPAGSPKHVSRWGEAEDDAEAAPLDMPVRITIRHDEFWVHEIELSFPEPLLRQALGGHVDPLELSLSKVQSAFIAPSGSGFSTLTLDGHGPAADRHQPARPDAAPQHAARPARRVAVPLVMASLVVAAAGGWWFVRGPQHDRSVVSATPVAQTSPHTSARSSASTAAGGHQATASRRTPNVTLRSDLAFGIDSAQLSLSARKAILGVARNAQQAGLHGRIYVDGYTDDLGSTLHGKVLSQQRADAVAQVLRSQLGKAAVQVVAVGHGEADPIASNATDAGRKQNRRVTITLPRS